MENLFSYLFILLQEHWFTLLFALTGYLFRKPLLAKLQRYFPITERLNELDTSLRGVRSDVERLKVKLQTSREKNSRIINPYFSIVNDIEAGLNKSIENVENIKGGLHTMERAKEIK